ncbi:ABC transporter substrate-binding protein [Clostridiales bacterium COT073_COT-073]|nr:ABC transporter substrate-binding protein [Clostridiales bacterium COT073_COT-073]
MNKHSKIRFLYMSVMAAAAILSVYLIWYFYFYHGDPVVNQDKAKEKTADLMVLGSYHEDMIKLLTELFARQSKIKIDYVRMSTQDAEAKLIAEKGNTGFDVWIGGTVDAHEILKKKQILCKCEAAAEKNIANRFRDKDEVWKAQYIEVLSIGINNSRWEKEFAVKGIKKPTGLEDLLHPAFKGEVILPSPETSGTGYTFLASVLAEMGEEKGWKYLEQLNKQIGQYTYSGYTPAEKVGLGEYLICINFFSDQQIVSSNGYDMESRIYQNAGWTIVPVSLIAKKEIKEEAKQFIDFCLSQEASDLLRGLGNVLTVRENGDQIDAGLRLSDLQLNNQFEPTAMIDKKEENIRRFLQLVQ